MRNDRAVAEIAATVLLLAITVAMSASMAQLTQQIREDIVNNMNQYSPYVKVSENRITVSNPSSSSIELNRLELVVDGSILNLTDANGNGIWEPFESLSFSGLGDMDGDGFISVTLLMDGVEVFHTIYTKSIELNHDMAFPQITAGIAPPENNCINNCGLHLNVTISDDSCLVYRAVLLGDANATESVFNDKDLISSLASGNSNGNHHDNNKGNHHDTLKEILDELRKELDQYEKTGEKGDLMEQLSYNSEIITIPSADLENTSYIRFIVKDITGKTSSKILTLDSTFTGNVSVIITRPPNGTVTYEGLPFSIEAVAINAIGVALNIDGNNVLDGETAFVSPYTFGIGWVNLPVGTHVIEAVAWNAVSSDNDSATITVKPDGPPAVQITSPADGSTLSIIGDNAIAHISANITDEVALKSVSLYVDGIYVDGELIGGKQYTYSIDVNLSKGSHEIRVVANDTKDQTATDSVNVVVVDNQPPAVNILSPSNGEQFVPGDPVIVAISKDEGIHSTTISIGSKQLNTVSTSLVGKSSFSTGWMLMSGNSDVYIPELGLAGNGTATITIKPASDYGATYTFKPVEKKGISDSRGTTFTLDVPSSARVKVRFASVLGEAGSILLMDDHPHCEVWRKVYSFSAPEGAKPIKAVVTGYMKNKMKYAWELSFYVNIVDKPSYINKNGEFTVSNPKYSYSETKILKGTNYRDTSRTLTHEIPASKADYLFEGMLLQVIGERYYCYGDYSAGASSARVTYYTEVKSPVALVDGVVAAYSDSLSKDKLTADREFSLSPGKHTIELRSEHGAFRYWITVIPDSNANDPSYLKVTTPWGNSTTMTGKITHSGPLEELFGRFYFDAQDDTKYLVKIDYTLEEVTL